MALMDSVYSILLLCLTFLLPFYLCKSITMSGYERDYAALLAIKSQFHDPLGFTTSWNNSISMCSWNGVKCGRKHQRVTQLNLSLQQLRGSLSSSIGNLSFLSFINLTGNILSGEIPNEIGKLSRLHTLDIYNNTFMGMIPINLSYCSNLIYLDLSNNNLVGKIPEQLGYLSKLEKLFIFQNYLTGGLPDSIGNLSHLQVLSLSANTLQGRIPDTLGQLRSLRFVGLFQNSFSGTIPLSIYNISSLELLQLNINQLHGGVPQNFALNLPNLEKFNIGANNHSGPIPDSLANASKIVLIDMSSNYFTGQVSLDFIGLKNLEWLNFANNSLTSGVAFVTSLTNCSRLELLALYMNQFVGTLPSSIANLSTTLTGLYFGGASISGTIPLGIGNLVNIQVLALELNQLSGPIPQSIGKLTKLHILSLSGNNLLGIIPVSIGNLTRLIQLYLDSNNLQGSIPPSLGRCQNLLSLKLSRNKLTGEVPQQILSITALSINLDLSDNNLTGSFPLEVGNLKNLVSLDISGNQFHGEIPATLGGCVALANLNLSGNYFNGSIPHSASSLKSITTLDLSHNMLTGQIPKYFENLSFLQCLNLSYNHFEGEVPTNGVLSNATAVSLVGNEKLCGGLAEFHLPSCQLIGSKHSKRNFSLKLILISCGVLGSFMLLLVLLLWFKKKENKEQSSASFSPNSFLQLSYQQLLKATNGFSLANLLGEGSFGRVYKGVLEDQGERNVVAVKVMNLEYKGASKSFIAECAALRNIRHRNLVKVISACSSVDFQGNSFKAVIYDFMPNGSLDKWLHILPRQNEASGEPKGLSFLQRLNMAIEVASALDYLHHHCQVPIIHCDVKPSNVLLDNDMVAHLADFGLARSFPKGKENVTANQTSSLGLKGTIGYAAPEYAMGSEARTSGDVYSFGILLLETFTGKRPIDDAFRDGLNLHNFAKMALLEEVLQITDPYLVCGATEVDNNRNPNHFRLKRDKIQGCLISIFKIGIACSAESLKDRLDISDAAKGLRSIRDELIKAESTQDRNNNP